MIIDSVRLGLATNSSSTHSILLLPDGENAALKYRTDEDSEFGCNNFTAASPEAKGRYAAIILREALRRCVPEPFVDIVWQSLTDCRISSDYDSEHYGHIDHQSVFCLPVTLEYSWYAAGNLVPDMKFYEEFRQFLLRPDVAILGGENVEDDDEQHPAKRDGKIVDLKLPLDENYTLISRKDPVYGYWVLFNRNNGTKIRLRFDDVTAEVPNRASAPELIDLKITDYCPFKCSFCYQDSTESGNHADYHYIESVLNALEALGVFEVAIGGGEPTMHPDFVEILDTCRRNNIVPNFSTRSLDWLRNDQLRTSILEKVGAFALSANDVASVQQLVAALDYHKIERSKAAVHLVMGANYAGTGEYSFSSLVQYCCENRIALTLLGYKATGRGKKHEPGNYDWWLDEIYKLLGAGKINHRNRIGIDTALASAYKEQLQKRGIPKCCYETQEGRFSMYVDAVTKRMGQSSYMPDDELVELPIDNIKDRVLGSFRAWNNVL